MGLYHRVDVGDILMFGREFSAFCKIEVGGRGFLVSDVPGARLVAPIAGSTSLSDSLLFWAHQISVSTYGATIA